MLMMRNADLDLCKLAPEHEMWPWSLDPRMIFRLRYSPKVLLYRCWTLRPPRTALSFNPSSTLFLSPFSSPIPHIHFHFLRTIMVTSIDYPFRASASLNLELLTQHCSESFYRSPAATSHLIMPLSLFLNHFSPLAFNHRRGIFP